MNRATSLYLDLLRLLAAGMVLLVHARHERFTSGWLHAIRNTGNDAVMVFFVLSGFVIAYCAQKKEVCLTDFAVSRFTRLYSVVFPALILTVLLDCSGSIIDPGIYKGEWFQADRPVLRFLLSLFFLNEIWFLSVMPFGNGPFWSICYEFWYYCIFASIFYLQGNRRLVALGACLLIAGPKIVLLLPVWWSGVWAYRICLTRSVTRGVGVILFVLSLLVYAAYRVFDGPRILQWYTLRIVGVLFIDDYLQMSKEFLSDYFVGLVVAVNFIGLDAMFSHLEVDDLAWGLPISSMASYTFSMYLFHFPLLSFWAAALHHDPNSVFDQVLLLILVLLSVWLVGAFTEQKKYWLKTRLQAFVGRWGLRAA